MLTQESVLEVLKSVKYPGYSRDVVSFGLVKHVAINEGAVSVSLELTSANPEAARQIKAESERALQAAPGVTAASVEVRQPSGQPQGPDSMLRETWI